VAVPSRLHDRVPRLRTALPACLHSLSTGVCTPRLDGSRDTLKTFGAVHKDFNGVVSQAPGAFRSQRVLQGPAAPNWQEPSHATSPIQDAQTRDKETRVPLPLLIPALPFAVVLVLFLAALLRCDRADIPAIITALADVVNALRLRRRQ
jgi:hypothetical protein